MYVYLNNQTQHVENAVYISCCNNNSATLSAIGIPKESSHNELQARLNTQTRHFFDHSLIDVRSRRSNTVQNIHYFVKFNIITTARERQQYWQRPTQ